jgi:hypothetical protein
MGWREQGFGNTIKPRSFCHAAMLRGSGTRTEQKLYRVYDESREKWWKWRSSRIDPQPVPNALSAYDMKTGNSRFRNEQIFPAPEIAPDGKFFVVWRAEGMLKAHGLPEGKRIAGIREADDMRRISSHWVIRDGTIYAANGDNAFAQESQNRYWPWKPGESGASRGGGSISGTRRSASMKAALLHPRLCSLIR